MLYEGKIWVGTSDKPVCLLPQMANRHGLIAGATGTGKTVSLKVLAEGFSEMGVPVFLADIKGDLSGMVESGAHSDGIARRLGKCGVPSFQYQEFPTVFWDVYGKQGHPVRATVSEMGPTLLARMLDLNDTQTGVLNILFRVADDEGMLLLDLKDLKAMLAYVGENARSYTLDYGNVTQASIGAIQRAVAQLEDQGGDLFFGEPALEISDWLQVDGSGRGVINILAADQLFQHPKMYSTFLLWMLSELYELLPEAGDLDKPRMVFFFDEAHLLFNDCPRALLEKLEQVVRLIRSKAVGVYFVTQNPCDIPMSILGQLGNRIQHALRAYTPLDQKAVRTAAQTFRANPGFDTEEAITQLKTGEALVSFLDEDGAPGIVERATILPPQSSMDAIDAATRAEELRYSPFAGVYDQAIDRESAYEQLAAAFQKPAFQPLSASEVKITTAAPTLQKAQGFMVFDPVTGDYVQRELPQMTLPQMTAAAPVAPVFNPFEPEPAAAAPVPTLQVQPAVQTQQMPVMVYDPTTGQYRQQMMAMQLDPATGNYVPVPNAAQQPSKLTARELEKQRKEQEKAAREAERMEKERKAEERRQRADELREERAARARKNDSVLGRITNTAINTATRTVTNTITRGVLGGIKGLFK
ncbi:MAG: helicase HerA-like domain-containing protein [Aristaeellaceae bacterium]